MPKQQLAKAEKEELDRLVEELAGILVEGLLWMYEQEEKANKNAQNANYPDSINE